MERRICIHHNTKEKKLSALGSASLTRSLVSTIGWPELVGSLSSRLLRVYIGDYDYHMGVASVEVILKKANLRFLTIIIRVPLLSRFRFPCSWFQLWNLQTLKVVIPVCWKTVMAPSNIWEMPLLRHVVINDFELPDPLCEENDIILDYLQTLRVHKNLQSLRLSVQPNLVQNLCLPDSLKKLTLQDTGLNWEECATKIGSLPLLQYLYLGPDALSGCEWETVEGGFCSLKVLKLECRRLRNWRTEGTHFPCLELLHLRYLEELEEIPSSIGDIPTLKTIKLYCCSKSANDSANGIREEQLELGNMDLQIHIIEKTVITWWSYRDELKDTLRNEEEYCRFRDVLSDYDGNRIDLDGFIREVKVMFNTWV